MKRRVLLLSFVLLAPLLLRAQTDTNAAPADATPGVTNAPAPAAVAPPADTPADAQGGVPPYSNLAGTSAGNPQEDIDDIRPPVFFLFSWFWICVALGIAALVALLVWLWNKYKPVPQLSPLTAYDVALAKLDQARSLMNETQAMEYAVAVSEAVRTYLGQRFHAPSTLRTTEEFLVMMDRDPQAPLAEHRDLLRDFLRPCDLVKFGKYRITQKELEEVHERALTFVTATKPVLQPGQTNGVAA